MRHRPAQSRLARNPAPLWLFGAAASFLLYVAVLARADSFQRPRAGLLVSFDRDGAVLTAVVPGSSADDAGLQAGDRIVRYMDRPVATRLDWTAVDANVVDEPVTLEIVRAGGTLRATLPGARTPVWQLPGLHTIVLALARGVQLVCLVFALIVAFKKPHDRVARLGAWLLASVSVFSVVLPFGFAQYWRDLPAPLEALMWPPFVSAIAVPVLFFAFCAEFPTPVLENRWPVTAACALAIPPLVWHVRYGYMIVYGEARAPLGRDWSGAMVAAGVVYLLAGLAVLGVQYRRTRDTGERRRLRLLLVSTAIGCIAGALVAGQFWLRSTPRLTHSLFDSPVTLVGMPFLLVFPASIVHTILRHRVFDIHFIVRRGVQYALARRLLLSLLPALFFLLVIDLYGHRHAPLTELLRHRLWPYLTLVVLIAIAYVRRTTWLEALDRRFFRERYRAEQILRELVMALRSATEPREAVAAVVHQVDRALQPTFIAALGTTQNDDEFQVLDASPLPPPVYRLRTDSRVIALARVVRGPLDLSPDHDTWIQRHLPPDEASAVFDAQIELLIPVTLETSRELVLVLGPKRSEEPYGVEDRDLLEAIASNLGLLLDRHAPSGSVGRATLHESNARLAECPVCASCYDTDTARCPSDSAILMVSDLPRVLGGRYRLLRRVASGGMGVVYRARDEALDRTVAVKVLSGHLVGDADAARRFELEARTAASFSHPNVVTIHDFGVTQESRAFLVMELLEGRTLREELVATGPLDPARAVRIVGDVCDVLEAAHARGLVHRDLKPENVFLAQQAHGDITKVLDFGIAKVLAPGPMDGTETQTGVLLGTLAYMSPEQLRGERADPLADLWALTVIAYEALSGVRPPAPSATMSSRARLPGPVMAFFTSALSDQRDARPQTARALRDMFRSCSNQQG